MISIYEYGAVPNDRIFARQDPVSDVRDAVAEILVTVQRDGDAALRNYAQRFDHASLTALEVSPAEIDDAMAQISPEFCTVLREAAANIRMFHAKQVRPSFIINEQPGVVMGQKVLPIEKVGLYVPGGTAAYPSTVLMDAIPAKLAGCRELVITTPPRPDGTVNPAILAAAHIAGVDRIFKIGGAQAIAALAFGTESVPRVDKIVGNASAVLVTDSMTFAQQVQAELERQLPALPRYEIARASIDRNGKIIVAPGDLMKAIDIANEIAPEHLELCVDQPFDYLDRIRHAGSIFLGKHCPEALGDYMAGPNHTLPTSGTARFSSPLSVDDFVKKTQFTYFTGDALAQVADKVALFARQEGLEAHARSALARKESAQ